MARSWTQTFGGNLATFTAPNYGRNSWARKERFPSVGVDLEAPSYKPRAEAHGTLREKVFRDTRYGRFGVDAKGNKPPPKPNMRLSQTAAPGPRMHVDQVNVLSRDHPRFPYHHRTGRFSDAGKSSDYEMAAQPNYLATSAGDLNSIPPPRVGGGGRRGCGDERHDLGITLAFPRSFTRASGSGLKLTPRFEKPPRKAYSSRRVDVDPYKNTRPLDPNWIKKSVRFDAPGSGTRSIAFGPATMQRSPRSFTQTVLGLKEYNRPRNLPSNQ